MNRLLRLILAASYLAVCFATSVLCDDALVVGKWEYRDGSFRDIHEFLTDGRMGNATGGTWAISNGELVVRWKNGWVNSYRWVENATTLSGTVQSPTGNRHGITLVRQGPPPPPPPPPREETISGKWEYRDGSFRDVHEFLPGGQMGNATGGTWAISNGELVVRWKNGWVNSYRWAEGASTLSGTVKSPSGDRHGITLVPQEPPPPPREAMISGKWEYRHGSFRDVHEFLADGRMGNATGGTWAISNGELVVRWKNGWINSYRWEKGATTLNGNAQSPTGDRSAITLVRQ